MAIDPERFAAEIRGHQRVALDSAVLIYHLENIMPYADLTESAFAAIADGSVGGILSTISLTELLAKPFVEKRLDRVATFERFVSSFPRLDLMKVYTEPLSHGRNFSKEEIWDNYGYFIKKVVPVAEEAGVRIGIHPDDPPQPEIAGVPRCIFSNFEGYKKALEIANSPNIGICLCVGCWLEGGPLMGKDEVETIKDFGSRKKLFKVHFRNVSAPLPHFNETLVDDG